MIFLFFSCKDKVTQVDDTLNIQFTLVDGMLWADFRYPTIPDDDAVRCEFIVIVKNNSKAIALQNVKIKELNVFYTDSVKEIGIVQLETSWDGYVSAGATDTIHLIKKPRQGPTLIAIPCDSVVTYVITLMQNDKKIGEIKKDSVEFICYQ